MGVGNKPHYIAFNPRFGYCVNTIYLEELVNYYYYKLSGLGGSCFKKKFYC